MAISIDAVYQKVLALANKEQRGYITPLEFNLLANQAQLIVFEQYFYDRHQSARIAGSKINHSDVDSMLDEKISIFEKFDVPLEERGGEVLKVNNKNNRLKQQLVEYRKGNEISRLAKDELISMGLI